MHPHPPLQATQLETPLGIMLAIANEEALFFLDFVDRSAVAHLNRKLSSTHFKHHLGLWESQHEPWNSLPPDSFFHEEVASLPKLERKIKQLCHFQKAKILPGQNKILRFLEKELEGYFAGHLKNFKTPFQLFGSSFQKRAWQALLQLPYATTKSYAEQAMAIGNPTAIRAVANANGANRLAILIPCHRIIGSHGQLGGYGSGLRRKKWLLEHEQKNADKKMASPFYPPK